MDLPPSGWYPDPYGVPGLLRWWDGTVWTDHTCAETAPAATSVRAADPTRVEPGMQLAVMRPPTGPRTEPQPAIPDSYDDTRVLTVDNTTWAGLAGGGYAGGYGPGGYGPPGYSGDDRRRKLLLYGGLTGGVAAACAVVALVVTSMNSSAQPPSAPPAVPATVAASASAAASPSPSVTPSASPSPTATAMSTVTDATSGLTYGQLPTPWAPGCPATLNNPQVFTWAAGESAVAGQVSNGQTTWYGTACSGTLPAQYGYTGTADLENVTNALANAFNGAYYAALPHNFAEVQSQPVAVSGHPGWEIKFLQTYTSPQGMAWTNELGAVVVTDPGNGAAPAVFYVSVPGNLNEANVDTLVSSLQLTPPTPQPSATPSAPQPSQ